MDLVVGASESTAKSLLSKLGALLAQEYTLIRGVGGDLQYINDELATMQSFLRDLGAGADSRVKGHDHRMKDWMKQIRDLTYDVEDCIDDSGNRIHTPAWLRRDICCYFAISSAYEILTWWPRRDISTKISDLKMRAQQIGERRQRYGVIDPKSGDSNTSFGFKAAENQDSSSELVFMKNPVGVDMKKLDKWVDAEKFGVRVLSIVGFGGAGKTTIATSLYHMFSDQFDCRAKITVSQRSDINAIVKDIHRQVVPQSNDQNQKGSSREKSFVASFGRVLHGTAKKTKNNAEIDKFKEEIKNHLEKNR